MLEEPRHERAEIQDRWTNVDNLANPLFSDMKPISYQTFEVRLGMTQKMQLPSGRKRSASSEPRVVLRRCLEVRQEEMERAILTRVHGIADPSEVADPEYAWGLRRAVSAALDFAIAAVGPGEEGMRPVPAALLAQAHAAARGGVSLDTVLRRYCAGNALMGNFIMEEAERCGLLKGGVLKCVLRTQAVLLDRLLTAVSEEYTRELESWPSSSKLRRVERIERLLAGELVDASGIGYRFDANHVALIAAGPGVVKAIGDLASASDRCCLVVQREEDTVWAWLGGRRAVDLDRLTRLAQEIWPAGCSLAIGEPAEGLDGWRLTHRQAGAAHPIALRKQTPIHYAEVALLASILQDDLIAASLHELYLAPLERERDGGETFRKTLRAHFAAGGSISSIASALGVNRNTVTNRLRKIEDCLGKTISSCTAELETALALEEFNRLPNPLPVEQIAESSALS